MTHLLQVFSLSDALMLQAEGSGCQETKPAHAEYSEKGQKCRFDGT